MDEHSLRVLEFYKVRELLAGYASSEPGALMARKLLPSGDRAAVERALREAGELRHRLDVGREFPIGGLRDISVSLGKSAVEGAALRPGELLNVLSVARTSRLMKDALGKSRNDGPLLAERSASLGIFDTLEFEITHAIGEDGEVLDGASFDLKRIRRNLTTLRTRINRELEAIIHEHAKAVQEPVITVRDDRYCLSLKPGFRQYLQGIVHDTSASGATVFVEPEKTVELNNRLATSRAEEEREIERVLWRLTEAVRELREGLLASFAELVALDVLYAKAGYALATGGSMPAIRDGGVVELREARHPLLIKAKGIDGTVPVDVRLGKDFTTLVITGPNTGGKTVVLKTAGLLCLMAQAGMLIPAGPDSALSVFDNISSDIGDEQSVEQSLSTFSSHIGQIARILQAGEGKNSLVLLDELGAGTDPAEGSALGVAIIAELHKRGARVIVTTHHGALKVFAANTPGVMNASVEFDPETLMPTYKLLVGRPGRSNALVVAERLGMPASVVESARKTRGSGEAALDTLIERLEGESAAAREDRTRAAAEMAAAREDRLRMQEALRRSDDERREAVRRAKEKASTILSALRFKLAKVSPAVLVLVQRAETVSG